MMNLDEVARELTRAARRAVPPRRATAAAPATAATPRFADDPHWQDLVLFYEYFHGDNGRGLGASHQTGWTALVSLILDDLGRRKPG